MASIGASATVNGQLIMEVIPTTENIRVVLETDGGWRAKACAIVIPYIAKVDGRYAITQSEI
jgi:hypothetical protein